MSRSLRTSIASALFERLKAPARNVLVAFNEHRFIDGQKAISGLQNLLDAAREVAHIEDEDYLNDMYVLDRYVEFISAYGVLWEKIIGQRFSDSWSSLQDSLDLLRLIKRFSLIDISYFENQLTELEKTYPYNVFFSIGATVEYFECSICGNDIDSRECAHMRGHLYRGTMAVAIARNITQLDHVSVVTHPQDKRCVVAYDDTGKQFDLIRYLSSLIESTKCRISDFGHLQFSKRTIHNPNYLKIGRNDPCSCGSGKKFKKCCISKEYIEGDHVDVIAESRSIEDAVA